MEPNKEPSGDIAIAHIIREAAERGSSDIHFTPGNPIMYRIDGDLIPVTTEKLMPKDIEDLVMPIMAEKQLKELEKGEVDFACSLPGLSRIRVNIFRQRGSLAGAIRILSTKIPDAKTLGIPEAVVNLTTLKRGIVLVTGATGSGKSTTLASLLNIISNNYPKHIITLEDPIEYLHHHNKAMVCQREIGPDTESYATALKAALRQDPDVILVGEMRDLETIQIAITAAETGHLVFSTLHTNSAADAVDRVIDVFPPHQQQQIRVQLASVIECVIAQQLLPKKNDKGRVAAFEVMLGNAAVRNLIREGKAFQIPSVIQTSRKSGMQMMDDSIYELVTRGLISGATAVEFAHDVQAMQQKTLAY